MRTQKHTHRVHLSYNHPRNLSPSPSFSPSLNLSLSLSPSVFLSVVFRVNYNTTRVNFKHYVSRVSFESNMVKAEAEAAEVKQIKSKILTKMGKYGFEFRRQRRRRFSKFKLLLMNWVSLVPSCIVLSLN